MLEISLTSVRQSLINLADHEFDGNDCGEDEARILSASFTSKDPTGAGYLISGAKKAFNILWHAFIQALIF